MSFVVLDFPVNVCDARPAPIPFSKIGQGAKGINTWSTLLRVNSFSMQERELGSCLETVRNASARECGQAGVVFSHHTYRVRARVRVRVACVPHTHTAVLDVVSACKFI